MAEAFDVVIIGSGFAGALAAATLAKLGRKVLILEAGPTSPPRRLMLQRYYGSQVFTLDSGNRFGNSEGTAEVKWDSLVLRLDGAKRVKVVEVHKTQGIHGLPLPRPETLVASCRLLPEHVLAAGIANPENYLEQIAAYTRDAESDEGPFNVMDSLVRALPPRDYAGEGCKVSVTLESPAYRIKHGDATFELLGRPHERPTYRYTSAFEPLLDEEHRRLVLLAGNRTPQSEGSAATRWKGVGFWFDAINRIEGIDFYDVKGLEGRPGFADLEPKVTCGLKSQIGDETTNGEAGRWIRTLPKGDLWNASQYDQVRVFSSLTTFLPTGVYSCSGEATRDARQ